MKITATKDKQQECAGRIIAWLHAVWERAEGGDPMQPDPFYARNHLLTEEVVLSVLGGIEDLMDKEFQRYPGYHYSAQGVDPAAAVLVSPGY
ncbi:MAG: hypothetical protein ACREXY_08720, partial [Gammaproteobacteria bacterium]